MISPRLSPSTAAPLHEHGWATESVHATSEGRIRYVRCTGCDARRVDLDAMALVPASAVSRVVG